MALTPPRLRPPWSDGKADRELVDPEPWRAEIRGQARRDKIKIRTFVVGRTMVGMYRVIAVRTRTLDVEELRVVMSSSGVQSEAEELARVRGHRVKWIRAQGRCGGGRFCHRFLDGDVRPYPRRSDGLWDTGCSVSSGRNSRSCTRWTRRDPVWTTRWRSFT